MKVVIQRVTKGEVFVEGILFSTIGKGYAILVGIHEDDTEENMKILVEKIVNLRIMSDVEEKMNRSILGVQGEILLVSQFTLCADLTYGRRPSFIQAKKPEEAEVLFNKMVEAFREKGIGVKTGKFGHYMDVRIHNDGLVTIVIDTKKG